MRPDSRRESARVVGGLLVLVALVMAGFTAQPAAGTPDLGEAPGPARTPSLLTDLPPPPALPGPDAAPPVRPAGHGPPVHVPRGPIRIASDSQFTLPGGLPNVANGVVRGSGTAADPYVVEGWQVLPVPLGSSGITISGTTKHVLVRGNLVADHRLSAADRSPNSDGSGKTALQRSTGAGVLVVNAANVRVEDNLLQRNDFNLVLAGGVANAQVHRNTLQQGAVGWWMEEAVGPATATANVLVGNARHMGVFSHAGVAGYVHSVDATNTLDGAPVRWLVGPSNLVVSSTSHPAGFVAVVNGANVQVTGHVLAKNVASVVVAGGTGVAVHNNTLTQNQAGVLVSHARSFTLADNRIAGNVNGAWVARSSAGRVTHNLFDVNTTPGGVADGLLLHYDANDNRVDNNTFTGNQVGIDVLGQFGKGGCPLRTLVRDNNLQGNWFAGLYEEFEWVFCLPNQVRASHNWWGAASGPGSFEGNPTPSGAGDDVTSNVVWAPYRTGAHAGTGPR